MEDVQYRVKKLEYPGTVDQHPDISKNQPQETALQQS